jgi:hypothetical protein
LFGSYATAAAAMIAAALYLFLRLRLYVTTTTMLVGSLLLVYGPASLSLAGPMRRDQDIHRLCEMTLLNSPANPMSKPS